jgi:hypothetical protein
MPGESIKAPEIGTSVQENKRTEASDLLGSEDMINNLNQKRMQACTDAASDPVAYRRAHEEAVAAVRRMSDGNAQVRAALKDVEERGRDAWTSARSHLVHEFNSAMKIATDTALKIAHIRAPGDFEEPEKALLEQLKEVYKKQQEEGRARIEDSTEHQQADELKEWLDRLDYLDMIQAFLEAVLKSSVTV